MLFSTWIDTGNRTTVAQFYLNQYMASQGVDPLWTGSLTTGDAGTTSAEFKTAVFNRVNYFRSMAGVDNITSFDPTYNQKAQQAALMMSANGDITHTPPQNWQFYTADGAEAAARSNLTKEGYGPTAVDIFMDDRGESNVDAGHRRWILYPQTQTMGTGDVPGDAAHIPINALWIWPGSLNLPRPATRNPYVAWPNAGFVPYQVINNRWSFSYDGADFSNATVSVTRNGAAIGVTQYPVNPGTIGETSLVWDIPAGTINGAADTPYVVNVNNVKVNNVAQNFTYNVTTFDPIAAPAGAPAVVNTAIGTATDSVQRSMVKQIQFTFDRPVSVDTGAVLLQVSNKNGSGRNDGSPDDNITTAVISAAPSNNFTTWTYTFLDRSPYTETSGSLRDGVYTMFVIASKITAGGSSLASGPIQVFHRLFGDVNASKNVNTADFGLFRNAFGKTAGQGGYDAAFDFDGNGVINTADYGQFRTRFGKTLTY